MAERINSLNQINQHFSKVAGLPPRRDSKMAVKVLRQAIMENPDGNLPAERL